MDLKFLPPIPKGETQVLLSFFLIPYHPQEYRQIHWPSRFSTTKIPVSDTPSIFFPMISALQNHYLPPSSYSGPKPGTLCLLPYNIHSGSAVPDPDTMPGILAMIFFPAPTAWLEFLQSPEYGKAPKGRLLPYSENHHFSGGKIYAFFYTQTGFPPVPPTASPGFPMSAPADFPSEIPPQTPAAFL